MNKKEQSKNISTFFYRLLFGPHVNLLIKTVQNLLFFGSCKLRFKWVIGEVSLLNCLTHHVHNILVGYHRLKKKQIL